MGQVFEKISVAMIANNLDLNGISTVVVNYCTHLDKNRFEVVIFAGAPFHNSFCMGCREAGVKIIALPSRRQHPFSYYKKLYNHLTSGHFDIAHVHGNSATMAIELSIAAICGIKERIAHCHTSACGSITRHKMLLPIFKRAYTQAFSCSTLAGDWIFGKGNYRVIPNGFTVSKFLFDVDKRKDYRKQLQVENCFVIGHVGRINQQKNQFFLLRLFERIAASHADARLLLVGTGPDREGLEQAVNTSDYKPQIIIYGNSDDVAGLMSAMDVFVFPSRVEGLGIALLEAQISGLPCVSSDVIPKEVMLGSVEALSLSDSMEGWEQAVMKWKKKKDIFKRKKIYDKNVEQIKQYDIEEIVKCLEELYLQRQRGYYGKSNSF